MQCQFELNRVLGLAYIVTSTLKTNLQTNKQYQKEINKDSQFLHRLDV